jgi:hypothetical protein
MAAVAASSPTRSGRGEPGTDSGHEVLDGQSCRGEMQTLEERMNREARRRCIIVGGGSSGWMTAAYLSRTVGGIADITLVESSRVSTIGVGEATFSTFKLFFDALGLDESVWMPECSASYKLAIRFVDRTKQKGHFYHPFERFESLDGRSLADWWLKLKRHEERFDQACFVVPALCDALRSPRHLNGDVYASHLQRYFPRLTDEGVEGPPNVLLSGHRVQYPYGYHLNASELATFLRSYAMERSVHHVLDDVVGVPLAEDGSIAGIQTKEGGLLQGDLYIDCTGFRGLLINAALGEPFISYGQSLLNDAAVAIQVPRDVERDGIRPYTTAQAHSAGWSWNIPLYGRDGTGYVYASRFISAEQAERELREHLGPAADASSANHIKMRIGRNRRSWVKNCVAIGLSSGFVEPLESTGLFFIQHAIEELVNHFPGARIDPDMVAGYNQVINDCMDGVRDFLTLHYVASDRDDTPFWRAARNAVPSESLATRLEIWRGRLPSHRNIYQPFHGFEADSWVTMSLGLNRAPIAALPIMDTLDEAAARASFRSLRERAEHLVATLPSVYDYLTRQREDAAQGSAKRRSFVAELRRADDERTVARERRSRVE